LRVKGEIATTRMKERKLLEQRTIGRKIVDSGRKGRKRGGDLTRGTIGRKTT